MNPVFEAAFARMLARLPPADAAPGGELGYGYDVSCVTDCADDFRTIGPNDPRIITEAIARRLQTPRGIIRTDREYGLDLRGYMHKALTQRELRQLQTQALGEVNKETRIDPSATRLELALTGAVTAARMRVSCFVRPLNPLIDPFPFVLRVTTAAVEVEA